MVKVKQDEKVVISKYYGTGRRKTSVARVWIAQGKGDVIVNSVKADDYLCRDVLLFVVKKPFLVTDTLNQFDVMCTTKGGGLSGQAGAISHGISRALVKLSDDFKDKLKKAGLLTRDDRMKERKKYGCRRARKKTQYRKR